MYRVNRLTLACDFFIETKIINVNFGACTLIYGQQMLSNDRFLFCVARKTVVVDLLNFILTVCN